MIEYLILLWLLGQRDAQMAANDTTYEHNGLKPYAGLYYEGEE